MYRKVVEWMKGIDGLWISHLLAVSFWQDGLKVIPREECTAQSISKNTAFFPGMNFNFWPFQINLPWSPHGVHSQTGSSSLKAKNTGFWIGHLTGRSEIYNSSAELGIHGSSAGDQQKLRNLFLAAARAETNQAAWKLTKTVHASQQTKQLLIQWKDIW